MIDKLPSSEILNAMFTYDASTGDLYKRPFVDASGRFQTRYSKSPIRNILLNHGGKRYYRTSITGAGKDYLLHRIIFKMVYGWVPENIDHEDGNGLNNRIGNLQASDPVSNHQNVRRSTRNSSGVMGVSLTREKTSWRARIKADGREILLGVFKNFDDAVAARRAAEIEYNFHPNHGTDRPL